MIFKLLELILKEKILRKDLDLVSENTPIIKTEDYVCYISRIYPIKKCRKDLEIIHLRRREEKVDSFFLSELVEVGFKSAFLGFLLTSDHRSYKQSFRNEALLFCKIQVKFGKNLSKQLVYKYRGKEK